ncbi:MAG: hemerythrin domain-containing protein [Planctomycetota bacterium]
MRAIDILRAEHEEIHEGLALLLSFAERIATGERVAPGAFAPVLGFLEVFADGIHHANEETLLFPALERSGFPRERGPLAVMFHEHEQSRVLLRAMQHAADDMPHDPTARSRFVKAARVYADLLANHMGKEDGVLFVIAEKILSPAEAEALDEAFARFDETMIRSAAAGRRFSDLAKPST